MSRAINLICTLGLVVLFFGTTELFANVAESSSGFWDMVANADTDRVKDLATSHLWFALLLCFVSGILTSFTPCVYPMIPITISIFGRAAQKNAASSDSPARIFNTYTFGLSGIYVAGMAATYSVMGLVAGMTGSLFGKVLQSPFMLGFLVLLFLTLALGQLGLFKIALPTSLQNKLSSMGSSDSYIGIFIMGVVAGLIVSPCVGPIIAGILAFVFESSNALKGFLYFLSFSLGLGVLFLLIGGFSGLVNRLPRSGAWMNRVNRLLAILLLIAAGYYGMILINQTGIMKNIAPVTDKASSVKWHTDEEKAFALAKKNNLPILVDFTADWCAVCHEIDKQLFKNPKIEKKFEQFILLRFDVTQEDPENSRTLKKYGVFGLPAIVFVSKEGKILKKPRVHGLVSVDEFLSTLNSL